MAASPHQQEVLAGRQLSGLVAKASEMAEAGDEQGCMQKMTEAKGLLGTESVPEGPHSGRTTDRSCSADRCLARTHHLLFRSEWRLSCARAQMG
jgi:hypothetical protein